MKKSIYTCMALWLWILLRLPVTAQPGDPDCAIVYDSILPAQFAPGYAVGQNFHETLIAVDDSGGHHDDALFSVFDALPPGISLEGNILSGTFTTAGSYIFTLEVTGGPECPAAVRTYMLDVLPGGSDPCTNFKIHADYGEGGFNLVGNSEYYGICSAIPVDSIFYTVLHLPAGFSVPYYTPGNPCIEVWGAALETGVQSIIVAATTGEGCQDTLYITSNYQCPLLQPISPDVPTLPTGAVSINYNQPFYIEFPGVTQGVPFHLELVEGTLPPGLTLLDTGMTGGYLRGVPTTPGIYTFTMRATLGTSCSTPLHEYTLTIEEVADCSDFSIGVVYATNTYGFVGIPERYDICNTGNNDPVQYTAISLLPNYSLSIIDAACADLSGSVTEAGTFSMVIAGQSPRGCVDTLTISNTWTCLNGTGFDPTTLPSYTVGQHVHEGFQSTSYAQFRVPMTYEITSGILPPGLTLTTDSIYYTEYDAFLTGKPTTPGIYTFTLRAYLGINCAGTSQTYTIQIGNPPAPRLLVLTPLCADSIAVRNWSLYNPNEGVNVLVNWELLYAPGYHGTFIAAPGYTTFSTPNVINPNTIKITWNDGITGIKNIVRGASAELCNPPACVVASRVVTYHQGLQKDGAPVPAYYSDATQALGEPDANDTPYSPPRYFSLGYSGFIVLQLSSNVADQPGNDLFVHETSYGDPSFSSHPEKAEVFVSQEGSQWVSLGLTGSSQHCNEPLDHAFDLAGKLTWCRYIKIVDKTDRHAKILTPITCLPTAYNAFNNASNGYDVDGVTCGSYTGPAGLAAARSEAPVIPSSGLSNAIYPNPVNDILTVDFSQEGEFALPEDGNIRLDIHDLNGKPMYQKLHTLDAAWKTQCDVTAFKQGVFILRVQTKGVSRFYKFVKY